MTSQRRPLRMRRAAARRLSTWRHDDVVVPAAATTRRGRKARDAGNGRGQLEREIGGDGGAGVGRWSAVAQQTSARPDGGWPTNDIAHTPTHARTHIRLLSDAPVFQPSAIELFRSPLPGCGTLCRWASRRRRQCLISGNIWRPISSVILSLNLQYSDRAVISDTIIDLFLLTLFTYLFTYLHTHARTHTHTHTHTVLYIEQLAPSTPDRIVGPVS